MIVQNLAHEAALRRNSVRFSTTADLLNDLSALDSSTLRARIKPYVAPRLLVLDEVG